MIKERCLWCGLSDSSQHAYLVYYHNVGLFCDDTCYRIFMVNNDRKDEMKIVEITRFELMDFE